MSLYLIKETEFSDFIGKNFPTSDNEHVHVLVSEIDGDDKVNLVKY